MERDGRAAGALLFVLSTYGIVATMVAGQNGGTQPVLVALYAIGSATCFVLPWWRTPDWSAQVVTAIWLLLLTLGAGADGAIPSVTIVGYVLVFVYVGMTDRPVIVIAVVALAEIALTVVGLVGDLGSEWGILTVSIVMAAVVGQIPALAVFWGQDANELLGLAQRSLLELEDASSEEEAANGVARLIACLLDADRAIVLMTEHPGSTVYVGRGGHALTSAMAEIRVDVAVEQSGLTVIAKTGEPLFVADEETSTVTSKRLSTTLGIGSAMYIPMRGEGGTMGAAIAWWRIRRSGIDPYARKLAETMVIPAAQVLSRARQVGRLDAPAMRDPLTGAGNRRRFDLALADLPIGGTVLLFDLDAFGAFNDMHGRQAGDEALRAFAEALRRSVRQNDVVARIGDDTFSVVLPVSASSIASGIIIERLQRAWRAPQGCRFSVGVAIRTDEEAAAETLHRATADLRSTKRLKTK